MVERADFITRDEFLDACGLLEDTEQAEQIPSVLYKVSGPENYCLVSKQTT